MTTRKEGNGRGVAVIWVHYHTPELLRASVDAVRRDLPAGIEAELFVVDNGGLDSTPAGTTLLRPLRNVGYAAGINLGVSMTRSPNVIVMNPDVLVQPGCVPTLLDALGAQPIAAPDLYLDRGCRYRMPPIEACDFVSVCVSELGRRDTRWAGFARRRWRRHARRYWQARSGGTAGCHASGAMLAFTRALYHRIGPWDERYRLYFEEAEWLERARRKKVYTALLPGARAVHLYARSSRGQPRAGTWFTQSRARFERQHFHAWQNALLGRIRRRKPCRPINELSGRPPAAPAWIEVSPEACGYPAVTAWVPDPTRFTLPPDLYEPLFAGDCWLRWVDDSRRELATARIERRDDPGRVHAR